MPKISKPATAVVDGDRPILYPQITVCGVEIPAEAMYLTEDQAKELIGWEEETDGDKFGADYLLTLKDGTKVRCRNNSSNRPFDEVHCRKLAQDFLAGHWRLNGETLVVGRHGTTMSCQHRLVMFILACQMWRDDEHHRAVWPEPPRLQSLVVYGIDESKDVTRTYDTGKPRTLSDVLFADGEVFSTIKTGQRKALCKVIEFAIRFLWQRTGRKIDDAYAPVMTHSEALEFIRRHPSLLKCVKHIWESDGGDKGNISKLIPLGTASGLMYLMMTADSNPDAYRDADEASEEHLNLKLKKEAHDFWVLLARGEDGFKYVRQALGYLADPATGEGAGTSEEKTAIVVNAWLNYAAGNPMTEKKLGYVWTENKQGFDVMEQNGLVYKIEDGVRTNKLAEKPSCGGIDYGDPSVVAKERRDEAREIREAEEAKLKAAEAELKKQQLINATPPESMSDVITRIRKDHPEKMLLFPLATDPSKFAVYGSDALRAAKAMGGESAVNPDVGLQQFVIDASGIDKLIKGKAVLGVCRPHETTRQVVCIGVMLKGGGIELLPDDESPAPATPLSPIANKPKKATPVTPPKVEAPKPKKTLKGGTK